MGIKIQTIKDIRFYLGTELAGIYPAEEIRAISNIVISSVLRLTKMHQLYLPDTTVNDKQADEIAAICNELKTGKPVQYILGETLFYNCRIRLNQSTLIPRPETEELADLIIRENKDYRGKIIDFGTGSGCIAIALALNMPGTSVTGTDISPEALQIAEENAQLNNAPVQFILDDMLNPQPGLYARAGIIVSNPPYVRQSEIALMSKNVTGFEPHGALFVEDTDPLVYYRAIMEMAGKIMTPQARIYFEINEALGREMISLLDSFGCTGTEIVKDLNGKERIIKSIYHA
jgi:release factor glutamine methyltransferase